MKRILVTGGAGFLGSHLVDELIAFGYQVYVIDNLSTGNIGNVNSKVSEFYDIDVKDINSFKYEVDTIYHLAALPRVSECNKDPLKGHLNNSHNTIIVLNWAKEQKNQPRVIFSSSVAAKYPETSYGLEKLIGEYYCRLFRRQYGLKTIVFRLYNAYGSKRHSLNSGNLIPFLVKSFLKDKKLSINGDGKHTRDFIHYVDIVLSLLLAVDHDIDYDRPIEVGTGIATSIEEVASYFDCPVEYKPSLNMEVQDFICRERDIMPIKDFHSSMIEYLSEMGVKSAKS